MTARYREFVDAMSAYDEAGRAIEHHCPGTLAFDTAQAEYAATRLRLRAAKAALLPGDLQDPKPGEFISVADW